MHQQFKRMLFGFETTRVGLEHIAQSQKDADLVLGRIAGALFDGAACKHHKYHRFEPSMPVKLLFNL